ncbi:winged helix-turn-helix transcriptional regulator [Stigmatella aurantiaca]|uniref:Transcriptional regulator n=1 Tax=Stigmatella aurantiaca (strain DW4/3-1) TaxID=378806 RepID=Q08Z38_STIAD|nr:helix-turn-helix domain-containing protein [Stigmatella aurantiaca]ADO74503.1 Transcriptional regulator [Stigmatella aurantiaca DW4/3-1]EAU65727.1 transcriptional regulator, MarR family [Stigmatella aurantiaca DW4/3-1]
MADPAPSLCPSIQAALEILARPWTGFVLVSLQKGPLRYSELAAQLPGLGDKTLSARLKELEAKGFISRRVLPEPPIRVEYALTPKGTAFKTVMDAIHGWGQQFGDEAPVMEPKAATSSLPKRARSQRKTG